MSDVADLPPCVVRLTDTATRSLCLVSRASKQLGQLAH